MSIGSQLAEKPRAILICQVLGLCIFVAAFFLPAVRDAGPLTNKSDIFKGWECAKIAASAMFQRDTYASSGFLAVMSGWINPMILAYLGFAFTRDFGSARRILAVAILGCMVATWIFFAVEHLIPMIGHFMWIAGALIILSAEVAGRNRTPPAAMRGSGHPHDSRPRGRRYLSTNKL
jgi:hypothetical protein